VRAACASTSTSRGIRKRSLSSSESYALSGTTRPQSRPRLTGCGPCAARAAQRSRGCRWAGAGRCGTRAGWREESCCRGTSRGACLQQLDLDRADAATDLQHSAALDALLLDEVEDASRGRVEALAPVALRLSPGRSLAEDPPIPLRCAAVGHDPTRASGSRTE